MYIIYLKIVHFGWANWSDGNNEIWQYPQKSVQSLNHSDSTCCRYSFAHSCQCIMRYSLFGGVEKALVVTTRNTQRFPRCHWIAEVMAAIANNLFILAARDELTEAFFELCSYDNEAVNVSPAK